MKKFSKILSVALLVALVLSLGVANAFAAGEGSLTVKNSEDGVTYNFYKIFDLTGQDTTDPADGTYDAITYTIDPDWAEFFNGVGAEYISATNTGNLNPIKINGETKYINITETNKVEFTNAAMKYAIETPVAADDSTTGSATGADVSVTGLDLGYYLMIPVDMSAEKTNPISTGTVASLTSTIPESDIYVKATKPTIEKVDNEITVDLGKPVTYTVTGKVPNTSGTASYVYQIWDTMSTGLTFSKDVVVTVDGITDPITTQCTIDYATNANGFICTIPVNNLQDYIGKTITLTYHAVVNEDAVTMDYVNNTATVKYGRNPDELQESTPVSEEVYTAKITIIKHDSADKKLPNAEFALMKIENNKAYYYKFVAAGAAQDDPATLVNETIPTIQWVEVPGAPSDPTAVVTDAMAKALADAATAETITKKVTNNDGNAEFIGLADGTYYLIEIKAPDGYNRLDKAQAVPVTGTNIDDEVNSFENVANATGKFDKHNNAEADVLNQTGTTLPSTGGIGTTIFYVVGGVLVLAAIILLVTKKRMSE